MCTPGTVTPTRYTISTGDTILPFIVGAVAIIVIIVHSVGVRTRKLTGGSPLSGNQQRRNNNITERSRFKVVVVQSLKGNLNPRIRRWALSSCAARVSKMYKTVPWSLRQQHLGSNASKTNREDTNPNFFKRDGYRCSHRRLLDGGQSEPENPQVNLVLMRRSCEQRIPPLGASDVVVLPLSCRFMIEKNNRARQPYQT